MPHIFHRKPSQKPSGALVVHLLSWALGLALGLALHLRANANDVPEPAQTQPFSLAWGAGLAHYQEPGLMNLRGPQAWLQAQYWPTGPYLPELVQADLGAALLDYNSQGTGSLQHRPALDARGTVLWRIHAADGTWRGGLQVDLAWTDLRGTSSTGHRGYRRLGSKAWGVLQYESASGARTELGDLLRGRQDSLLSDAGGRDVSNTQRKGYMLAYQHAPLSNLWHSPRPWVRYSDVGRSVLTQ